MGLRCLEGKSVLGNLVLHTTSALGALHISDTLLTLFAVAYDERILGALSTCNNLLYNWDSKSAQFFFGEVPWRSSPDRLSEHKSM